MELLFKNVTTYNSENYDKFVEFHGKKFAFSYNAYNIIMLSLLLYCIILNIVKKNLALFLLFVALFALIILFRIYLPIKRHENTKDNFEDEKETNYTFSFYKKYFSIDKEYIYYFQLYRIYETADYFYLYIDDENAVLVSKSGFEQGTSEEFSKFIKKKGLLKYHKQS